jgi:hypothetical protein
VSAIDPRVFPLDTWFGHTGIRNLTRRALALNARGRRSKLTVPEADALRAIPKALAELRALYRARLRVELEDVEDSLSVVKLQAEELVHDGLSLDCLNPEDLMMLRKREPDWTPWGLT